MNEVKSQVLPIDGIADASRDMVIRPATAASTPERT
jgi:hypothetical protein